MSNTKELVARVNKGEPFASLAEKEGVTVQAIYQRFYRAGYRWDIYSRKYAESESHEALPERVMQVVLQCRGVKADRLTVALRLGFENVNEMHEYMSGFGFMWHEDVGYLKTSNPN